MWLSSNLSVWVVFKSVRKLKATMKMLSDGKVLGGKGRLTDFEIDNLQTFYGLAIRRNTTDVKKNARCCMGNLLSQAVY